ncbi:FadD3 family acyl-CoA ligase [Pseudoduganella namucuonensis]|nr:FadD3 family acyl-CoA ligase [Pseudoduganella namucuonensis]
MPTIPAAVPATIPQMLDQSAELFDSHAAIEDDGTRISYTELRTAVRRAAKALIADGVVPGDRVAVWAPNLPEWIIAALAIQTAGAVLVPVNTRMKGREVAFVLETSGARLLLCVGDFLGAYYPDMLEGLLPPAVARVVVLRGARDGACHWRDFLASGAAVTDGDLDARAAAVTADSLSDMMFTSGTTGNPKGVLSAHGQNLRAVAAWSHAMALTPADRYLIINPFFHAFGYKAGWLAALMHGCTILVDQVFDAGAVLERVARERVSVLPGPPTIFHSLLAHPGLAATDLSSLRATITGSTTIPPALIERMRRELGFAIVLTGYGLTESCGFATLCRADDDAATVAATSGRAMPGIELAVVDGEGKALAAGEPGEIVLRGYNVMRGYFNDEDATRAAIDGDGWLHTGDVGVLDERGYLRITDRMKDMYIVGGFNCYPAEVEKLMLRHESVAQVAVVGMPDERLGETGCAYVVLRAGARLGGHELLSWCRANMANYKVPRQVHFVDSLPVNASGKVLKRELRALAP